MQSSIYAFMFQPLVQGASPALYASTPPQAAGGGYCRSKGTIGLRGSPGWAGILEKADDQQGAARLRATLEQRGGVTSERSG
jgi:hypothetical protein